MRPQVFTHQCTRSQAAWSATRFRRTFVQSTLVVFLFLAGSAGVCGGDPVRTAPDPACTVSLTGVVPASASIAVGGSQQLSASVNAQGCPTTPLLAWTSGAANVASVSNAGLVTGIAVGVSTITATVGTSSAQVIVTVTPPPVATVEVSPGAVSLQVGLDKGRAVALVKDAQGNVLTGRAIAWQSLTPAVATVSATGATAEITAVALGTASMQATSEGKTAVVQISVVASPQLPIAWAWVRSNGTIANFTNHAISGAGRVTVQRTGPGAYQVIVAGIGTDAGPRNFAWHASALAGGNVSTLAGPSAICNATTLYPWNDMGKADVLCRSTISGTAADADFRIVVIANAVLGGTGAPSQRAMFSQGGPGVNSLAGFEPLSWNSSGQPLATSSNSISGRNRHTHSLALREPYIYFAETRAVLNRPLESCVLEREDANDADVFCSTKDGSPGGYHTIIAFEQGRPGQPWSFAKVAGNGTLNPARSSNAFGSIVATRISAGRYQVTFSGTQAAADPAVFLAATTTAGVWRACAHTLQSNSPVTIQVACWGSNSLFADSDFNLAFLR